MWTNLVAPCQSVSVCVFLCWQWGRRVLIEQPPLVCFPIRLLVGASVLSLCLFSDKSSCLIYRFSFSMFASSLSADAMQHKLCRVLFDSDIRDERRMWDASGGGIYNALLAFLINMLKCFIGTAWWSKPERLHKITCRNLKIFFPQLELCAPALMSCPTWNSHTFHVPVIYLLENILCRNKVCSKAIMWIIQQFYTCWTSDGAVDLWTCGLLNITASWQRQLVKWRTKSMCTKESSPVWCVKSCSKR